jgi:hypothetical protein
MKLGAAIFSGKHTKGSIRLKLSHSRSGSKLMLLNSSLQQLGSLEGQGHLVRMLQVAQHLQ